MKFAAFLSLVVLLCVGCGGAGAPSDGAYPIYGTVWSGTFSTSGSASTGTVNLTIEPNGVVNGIWQGGGTSNYTMAGTADIAGNMKGSLTNTSGGSNGSFSGAIVTSAGTGTSIQSATASGTMSFNFVTAFTSYSLSLKYSGAPRFRGK